LRTVRWAQGRQKFGGRRSGRPWTSNGRSAIEEADDDDDDDDNGGCGGGDTIKSKLSGNISRFNPSTRNGEEMYDLLTL
jgi:hypothetical protein